MNNPLNPPSQDGLPGFVNWNYLLMLGLRRLWLFCLCFLAIFLMAVAYIVTAPRLYQAGAVLQVEQQEQRVFKSNSGDGQNEDLRSADVLKTIEQNLQSYTLFLSVVTSPDIANDSNLAIGFPGAKDGPPSPPLLAQWVRENTKVALRRGTRLIDITVEHQVPLMAQKLTKAVIDRFIALNVETQTSTEQSTVQFLVEESGQIKEHLQKSEDSLEIYKESLILKDRIDDQQRVIDALRQRYREKHPQLIQARALMADLTRSFDLEFKKVLVSSKSEATYWAANNNDLSAATPEDRIATELKLVEARSNVLQREVDTESALFDNVVKQMREADVNRESAPTQVRVVEEPLLPGIPSKPRKVLILFIGFAAATAISVAVVIIVNTLDSTVKTSVEAEELFKLPVLGAIPAISTKRMKKIPAVPVPVSGKEDDFDGLIVISDPSSNAAEGFRSLRAAMSLLGKVEDHRTVLFTSALASEGKTFTSCNYAVSLAQTGLKTLLIDTDLRRPSIHTRFGLKNQIGFVDVVTRDIPLKEAVHSGLVGNLDILTSGSQSPNPAELLSGSGFREVMKEALLTYDRVVVDCSPVNLVSDSLLIAADVDTICLVVRAASTARRATEHALSLLRRAKIEPSGTILNFIPPWSDRLTYSYYSYKGADAAHYRATYAPEKPRK